MDDPNQQLEAAERMADEAQNPRNTEARQALTAFILDMQAGISPDFCARMLYRKLGGKEVWGTRHYY